MNHIRVFLVSVVLTFMSNERATGLINSVRIAGAIEILYIAVGIFKPDVGEISLLGGSSNHLDFFVGAYLILMGLPSIVITNI